MDNETHHQLHGIHNQLIGLCQAIFYVALRQSLSAVWIRETAEILRTLANRVKRLKPFEKP